MQIAIVGGFASQFGANAISLQPAMPIMKTMNLDRFTYWMSWSIYLHLHWYGARYGGGPANKTAPADDSVHDVVLVLRH